jgi:hypothetical protein
MLVGAMRLVACALALLVLTAVCAPIAAAASDDPMPCCRGEAAMMCCPFDGAGAWKACPGSQREAPPASLTVFALPVTTHLQAPRSGRRAGPAGSLGAGRLAESLPDPPPRG